MRTMLTSFAAALLPALAAADISQGTAPAPGGFLQVGAFETTCGCALIPGNDVRTFSTGLDLSESPFLPGEEPSLSAARSTAEVAISAAGTAGMGFLRGTASRWSPDMGWFAAGVVSGGWNDVFTVSHPAHNGQPGHMLFQVRLRAGLHAADLTGSAFFDAAVYKDRAMVAVNPLFSPGGADVTFGGSQWVRWGVAAFGDGHDADRTVDGLVTFAVPITFGQPFRLGVYAAAFAGQRSSGGFGGTWSRCSISFNPGLTWNGITGIVSEGGAVPDAVVSSASGIDWSGPAGCPADVNGDGFLDFFDYDDFVGAFETGGPMADFNGDGFVDFFDYDDFVGAFEAGC